MTFTKQELKAISQKLLENVDEAAYGEPRQRSWRLGPSSLDTDCDRAVWYQFRWVLPADSGRTPRMLRLLEHGRIMEDQYAGLLAKLKGFQLWTVDPNAKPSAKNKQFGGRSVGDHVGFYLDGICHLPPEYPELGFMPVEFKTAGTGRMFTLTKEDVRVGKSEHYDQMSYYGLKYQMHYGLYMAMNKNDDDLTLQVVELDWGKAEAMDRRMTDIIRSQKPPTRIKENATYFVCKMCKSHAVCHQGAAYLKNCRSCEYGEPIPGGQWTCNLRSATIPRDVVTVGCDQYHPIGR